MNQDTHEHLSCLVDGEISRETSRFLVRRLGVDEELRETWSRYHLVRDCLRHQDGGLADDSLCARVNRALEDAPAPSRRRVSVRWLKPAAGFAVAASVALMAVIAVGPAGPGQPGQTGQGTAAAPAESFAPPQGFLKPWSSQASLNGAGGMADRRINSYVVRHYQVAGSAGGKNIATFIPVTLNRPVTPADNAAEEEVAAEEMAREAETGQR